MGRNPLTTSPAVSHFRNLTERFCDLASRHGTILRPHGKQGPQFFAALPKTHQIIVLSQFTRYLEVCEEVSNEGESLNNDAFLTWRMIRRLKAHPTADLMSHLKEGDIVEIYNPDFVQIFRNFRFFSLCSYTLDELLSRPFFELFRRDENVTEKLVEVASELFSGKIGETYQWGIGPHVVEEIEGAGYRTSLENKVLSPLFNSKGVPVAAVNIIQTYISSRNAKEIEEKEEETKSSSPLLSLLKD